MVLTGTIGVGKTTVAEAVSDRLHAAGVRHGLLDLDWLGQLYPPPAEHEPFALDLSIRNLAAIVPEFVAAGATRLVLAATVTSRREAAAISEALGGGRVAFVRLTASAGTIAARIRARESGAWRDDFLARSEPLAVAIAAAGFSHVTVANEGRSPAATAARALEVVGWSL